MNEPSKRLTSPFVTKDCRCPVCRQVHQHRILRQRVFMPARRESDQHVAEYQWLAKNMRRVHPPFYFLFYCPTCYFSDVPEDFMNPAGKPACVMLVRQFNKTTSESATGADVIDLLGGRVNYEDIDLKCALVLHWLALFEQLLLPEDDQDAYKIGRVLLRVAWLYREERGGAEAIAAGDTAPFFAFPSFGEFVKTVKSRWPAVPLTERDAMAGAAWHFERALFADDRFDSPQAYFTAAFLTVDLKRRCDDLPGALEVIRGMYNTGSDMRQRLQTRLQKEGISDAAKTRLDQEIRRLNNYIQETGDLRHELIEEQQPA